MKKFVDTLENVFKEIDKHIQDKNKNIYILSTRRFGESLIRLEMRYNELCQIGHEIHFFDPTKENCINLSELQLIYMDKIESFFEHVYAFISTLAMLLNNIIPHKHKRELPVGKNKRFIEYLDEKYVNIKNEISLLEKAREFRAKFITHLSQNVLHDWMTYSCDGRFKAECVIIYFIKNSDNSYKNYNHDFYLNPYDLDFKPPISCSNFYVSPPHNELYFSIQLLVKELLTQTLEFHNKNI